MLRALAALFVLIALWQLAITITSVPSFILPGPQAVFNAFIEQRAALFKNTIVTATEIVLALLLGSILGLASAIAITLYQPMRRWALPMMVVSQSLPVFALAPLLTLWFGYGMGSKIVMATLIVYFPVTAASYDGLRHTRQSMIDLGRTLDASATSLLFQIRLPAALPSISSGLRVATSVAPIGAIVGEWVGSSEGLGYLMLLANGRMQTDLMFAALLCLCVLAYALYASVSYLLDRCLYWHDDTANSPVQSRIT
ncbi:MAG: ABC transporter permease [Granulosicoccus sp.]